MDLTSILVGVLSTIAIYKGYTNVYPRLMSMVLEPIMSFDSKFQSITQRLLEMDAKIEKLKSITPEPSSGGYMKMNSPDLDDIRWIPQDTSKSLQR